MQIKLNPDQLFNSKNIADNCDLIYAQKVSSHEYQEIKKSRKTVVISTTNSDDYHTVLYKQTEFLVQDNSVIYCHSDLIEDLFSILKTTSNLKCLSIITGQSDRKINKSLFKKKPPAVTYWYSPNITYKNSHLISIPLGVADRFAKKNLNIDDIHKNLDLTYGNKINKIYVNFTPNTNFRHRKNLYNLFSNKDFAVVDIPNITNESYHENLGKYNFTLCPWGNGIDTHRFWEALYSGSIPVTIHHETYEKFKGTIPILFVSNYQEINSELMDKTIKNLNNPKPVELSIDNLFQQIRENHKTGNKSTVEIKESYEMYVKNKINYQKREKKLQQIKILKTYYRKIYQRLSKR